MVEFAMLILPLLVLIFGVIEYARLQWTRGALQQVAIAGARCAGLRAVSCSVSNGTGRDYNAELTRNYVRGRAASWYVTVGAPAIVITPNTVCDGAGNLVRVDISYTFRSPFLAPISAMNMPVRASACFPNQS
ncbi:TadE/TadG family type IV pilus assembly protein [Sandarakinorhabdus sp. DWP1-3-1]|uniref:TadE/TadG family type IV pilus assembly protein n=1 Tax=Sandarakinorhabdus sp. DWP1-3-1 TaxID=2804627 RepID=UPI003CEB4CB8